MPFDPLPEPPHESAKRRKREDGAILFTCGVCMRQRVDVWALASEPDTFVVCPNGKLHNCPWCEDACIVVRDK